MGITVGQAAPTIEVPAEKQYRPSPGAGFLQYVNRNRQLAVGLTFLGLLALKYFFFKLFRARLQLSVSTLQRGIPLLDFGQHGVKSVDQSANFVAIRFDRADRIILVG